MCHSVRNQINSHGYEHSQTVKHMVKRKKKKIDFDYETYLIILFIIFMQQYFFANFKINNTYVNLTHNGFYRLSK